MIINKILEDEIINYCKVNNIDDVNKFINDLIKQSFTVKKYGNLTFSKNIEKTKDVEAIEIAKDNDIIKRIKSEPIIDEITKKNIYND